MTGIPRKLSLFFALLALLSLLFPDVIGQPGTVVSIPFTAPTSTGSYSVCHCMNVTWTSNVGAGDFTLHFDMWRSGTTYAPIDVQEDVPYAQGSAGGFQFGIPCSTPPGLYFITATGTSPIGTDFQGQSETFNVTSS